MTFPWHCYSLKHGYKIFFSETSFNSVFKVVGIGLTIVIIIAPDYEGVLDVEAFELL